VSTDLSGSIVVFPKILSNSTRDTIIQLSNTSNNLVHVKCFYINAQLDNPSAPPGPFNPRRWQVTDFELWLTRQQPTHWVASQGRHVNPNDGFGNDGSGLDPGAIPPVPSGFEGELKCLQVDASGAPLAGNSLKGEATIRRNDGDVSKYNAVSILAADGISDDNIVRLNNSPDEGDEGFDGGLEANACYNTLLLNHVADGAPNPVLESLTAECDGVCSLDSGNAGASCESDCPGGVCGAASTCVGGDDEGDDCCTGGGSCVGQCPIRTTLTLVPCSQDLENVVPTEVDIHFDITNEFEQRFSANDEVDCWYNTPLSNIGAISGRCSRAPSMTCTSDAQCLAGNNGFCTKFGGLSFGTLGSLTAYSQIQPVGLDSGVIGIAEELQFLENDLAAGGAVSGWAAWSLQGLGDFVDVQGRQRFLPVTRVQGTRDLPGGPVIDTMTFTDF
jgi:hypothetical protein